MRKVVRTVLVLAAVLSGLSTTARADEYYFSDEDSKIKASIRYVVIGRYVAEFKDFGGEINLHPRRNEIDAVSFSMTAKELVSRFSVLDNVVKSRKLLNVAQYPLIKFKSTAVYVERGQYFVKGTLDLHGVKKEIIVPFDLELPYTDYFGQKSLKARGKVAINRRDFKIIWNMLMDHGGLIVGDHITVEFDITAKQR